MSNVRTIRATNEGVLPGVRVVAIHGSLHADATPGRCGPVYADEENCLLRVVEARRTADGYDVVVETARPPLPRAGELPGYATRIGPWQARLEDHVVVLGPAELDEAHRLTSRSVLKEPPNVERFARWLRSTRKRDDELCCERLEDDGKVAAAWYCTRLESRVLFERIHRIVMEEFFQAVRSSSAARLEDASWWLSRAAIADEDIWLSGAGLRRAVSPDWELLLREGLRLPRGADLSAGLTKAEWHLEHPPPGMMPIEARPRPLPYPARRSAELLVAREPVAPAAQPLRYPAREAVRGLFFAKTA
jgi:hypothetical protein